MFTFVYTLWRAWEAALKHCGDHGHRTFAEHSRMFACHCLACSPSVHLANCRPCQHEETVFEHFGESREVFRIELILDSIRITDRLQCSENKPNVIVVTLLFALFL